jgi:F-type H+-transporting ATPase subunit alpha
MKIPISNQLVEELTKRIQEYSPVAEEKHVGYITSVGDGIARISGLLKAAYLERLEFPHEIYGFAMNLEEHSVGAIILGDYLRLKEGDEVKCTGQLLSVPVDEAFLGRVINPIGEPIDGKGPVKAKKYYPLEKIAPGVVARHPVNTPLQTGIKAIDAMIPIGRGQRELIIGDRNTGKTSIAVDAIINQRTEGVICIYVAIGQKTSRVAQVATELERHKAMDHTIIVAATASDSAAYQYIAPYAGCAIAEYFMDKGKDVLIVYDDLTKHAWAYRQISLVLKRPSGREAYPGDVFYLHSRLLERSCKLSDEYGGGSITALPIIETQANDVSAYIPTNIISITDGQIFLESDLFNAGQRPAINVGISVSRVGGSAQIKAMKKVAGSLKLDLAQYRSLAAFTQFSTDVDETTKKQIERGARMLELLKQGRYVPMSVDKQIASIWAGNSGYLDDIPVTSIQKFEREFLEFLENYHKKLLQAIVKDKVLTPNTESGLKSAVEEFKKTFTA